MNPLIATQPQPHPAQTMKDSIFVESSATANKPTHSVRAHGSSRYKTELCRPFQETGYCRYGDRCQFSHGNDELRTLPRHPKYKTELCKTYHVNGFCPYGQRCHFVHDEDLQKLCTIRSRQREYALKQQVLQLVEQKEKEVITALVLQSLRANAVASDTRLTVNPSIPPHPIGLDSQGQSPRSSFSGSPQPVVSPTSPQHMTAFPFDQQTFVPVDVNGLQQSLAQMSLGAGNELRQMPVGAMPQVVNIRPTTLNGLYPSSHDQGYARVM